MGSGELDDLTGPIVEVDGKAAVDLAVDLSDMIQQRNDEIREIKLEHRKTLKEVREALNTLSIFSSDPLADHQQACTMINNILEDNGV